MTDCLEELMEGTNVLLEQLMRLEQGLSVGETGDFLRENGYINLKKLSVDKYKMYVNPERNNGYKLGPDRFFGETGGAVENKNSKKEPLQAEEWTQTEKPALMEELEQAERMSTAIGMEKTIGRREADGEFSSLTPRIGTVSLEGVKGSEADGTVGSGVLRPEFMVGDTLDWAEQADRVFRRDSRRYDGGFCLY